MGNANFHSCHLIEKESSSADTCLHFPSLWRDSLSFLVVFPRLEIRGNLLDMCNSLKSDSTFGQILGNLEILRYLPPPMHLVPMLMRRRDPSL